MVANVLHGQLLECGGVALASTSHEIVQGLTLPFSL
jgi:hypothetical protein